jgi:hypothetical protein
VSKPRRAGPPHDGTNLHKDWGGPRCDRFLSWGLSCWRCRSESGVRPRRRDPAEERDSGPGYGLDDGSRAEL